MITLSCIECGKSFDAMRSSAKFCSANCRVKFNKKNPEPSVEETDKSPDAGNYCRYDCSFVHVLNIMPVINNAIAAAII